MLIKRTPFSNPLYLVNNKVKNKRKQKTKMTREFPFRADNICPISSSKAIVEVFPLKIEFATSVVFEKSFLTIVLRQAPMCSLICQYLPISRGKPAFDSSLWRRNYIQVFTFCLYKIDTKIDKRSPVGYCHSGEITL